ncbi:MAG: radical SAM protein [Candidatus Thermoplasmatota archaeon]|nr:radical SAM protein [Candidatus Thermoplasmatota archaeon]
MASKSNICEMGCGSAFTGKLPDGCVLCDEGAKMVMLVTGKCGYSCFFCPLSEKKKNKDVVYANELFVGEGSAVDSDFAAADVAVIKEAESIDAKGTGITGGDPMLVPERTIHFIKMLKAYFGKAHQIHMYCGPTFDLKLIDALADAGLDEIRFHPPVGIWNKMDGTEYDALIRKSIKAKIDTGVEIPTIPGKEKEIFALGVYLEKAGVKFLNLNELEFSETNCDALNAKGYDVKDEMSSAVKGSEETALKVVEKFIDSDLCVHYCSSSYKDAIQLRRRLARRAKKIARSYDEISEDGTIIHGVIEFGKLESEKAVAIVENLNISKKFWAYTPERRRIEMAEKTIRKFNKILKKNGLETFLVEEYPTADALEVEREPL